MQSLEPTLLSGQTTFQPQSSDFPSPDKDIFQVNFPSNLYKSVTLFSSQREQKTRGKGSRLNKLTDQLGSVPDRKNELDLITRSSGIINRLARAKIMHEIIHGKGAQRKQLTNCHCILLF